MTQILYKQIIFKKISEEEQSLKNAILLHQCKLLPMLNEMKLKSSSIFLKYFLVKKNFF